VNPPLITYYRHEARSRMIGRLPPRVWQAGKPLTLETRLPGPLEKPKRGACATTGMADVGVSELLNFQEQFLQVSDCLWPARRETAREVIVHHNTG
jgi:hypothetical protein